MSRLILSVLVATLAALSTAAARPDATRMTCAEAAATVAGAGDIVVSTGQYTYQRFVASGQFCGRHGVPEPGYSPTRDSPNCRIGYVCVVPDWLNRN